MVAGRRTKLIRRRYKTRSRSVTLCIIALTSFVVGTIFAVQAAQTKAIVARRSRRNRKETAYWSPFVAAVDTATMRYSGKEDSTSTKDDEEEEPYTRVYGSSAPEVSDQFFATNSATKFTITAVVTLLICLAAFRVLSFAVKIVFANYIV